MGRVVETVTAGSTVASAADSGADGDGERDGAADGTAATASGSDGACATAARKPALNKTINAKWRSNVDILRPRMPPDSHRSRAMENPRDDGVPPAIDARA
jgi:hypothetical protein